MRNVICAAAFVAGVALICAAAFIVALPLGILVGGIALALAGWFASA